MNGVIKPATHLTILYADRGEFDRQRKTQAIVATDCCGHTWRFFGNYYIHELRRYLVRYIGTSFRPFPSSVKFNYTNGAYHQSLRLEINEKTGCFSLTSGFLCNKSFASSIRCGSCDRIRHFPLLNPFSPFLSLFPFFL